MSSSAESSAIESSSAESSSPGENPAEGALAEQVASLLTVGFLGQELSEDLKGLLDRGISGVVLFRRNLASRAQAKQLISQIKGYAKRPLYVAVDQEGGRVQRLREGFTRFPPARAVGQAEDPQLAERVGFALGRELRAVGVDVNFAPVLDVDSNPENPVIGDRSLGSDPEVVARLGVALGRGLERAGVASCGKHFPGHGDTALDSHLHLPRLTHEWARLESTELVPFAAWAAAGLSSIMTAHVVFDAIEADLPATLSRAAICGILRSRLGFEGVVFSDDLEMSAIVEHFGVLEAAERSVAAGVDNLLCCHSASLANAIIDRLTRVADRDAAFQRRVQESSEKMKRFAARWTAGGPFKADLTDLGAGEELGLQEAESVLEELVRRSRHLGRSGDLDPTEVMEKVALGRPLSTPPSEGEEGQE